ncbi:MAG: hypothetical protein KF819_26745 [Labilithrix sp.]|nr:hypothetical protein [Labilithrix sp.]
MNATEAERASTRLELAALSLLAIVPILPYLVVLLDRGVPRFHLLADLAQMEYDTRRVWSGDTLLGLASRFGWSHPGPLLFYVLAPFQKLFGSSSTGVYVGTTLLSGAAAIASVVAARIFAGRAHAIAILVVLLAWLTAFGNVAANPWVRVVVVLPLFAFLVLGAFFALGQTAAGAPAIFFGAIAAETHVATVPTVAIGSACALGVFLIGKRRRARALHARERRHLWIGAAIAVVALVPPLVEQITGPHGRGNLARIVSFFGARTAPYKSLGAAIENWAIATSWLPHRAAHLDLADDWQIPFAMRWDPIPATAPASARITAAIFVASMLAAIVVARRRRDHASLAWLVAGLLGSVLAINALRAMVGDDHYSLIFWTTAASSLAWVGALSTACAAIEARLATLPARRSRIMGAAIALAGLLLAARATGVQRAWLARFPFAVASDPEKAEGRVEIHRAIRAEVDRDGAVPVVHLDGAWEIAMSVVLEHDKEALDLRLADADLWGFPGGRSAAGAPRVKHVWFTTSLYPLRLAPCLDRLLAVGDVTVLVADRDVASCDASPP